MMAGDFEPAIPDPNERKAAPGVTAYTATEIEAVLARVERQDGHGLTPREVKILALEIKHLRWDALEKNR